MPRALQVGIDAEYRLQVQVIATYELVCQLPAQAASERFEALLSKEGVEYRTSDLSIASTRTPFVLLSIPWVGFNPFVYISGIDVLFKPSDAGSQMLRFASTDFEHFYSLVWESRPPAWQRLPCRSRQGYYSSPGSPLPSGSALCRSLAVT